MLGLDKSSLLFPKLVYVQDVVKKVKPFLAADSNPPLPNASKKMYAPKPQTLRLYRIDWVKMEELKEKREWDRFVQVNRIAHPGHVLPDPFAFTPCLPESYIMRMEGMRFAISDSYMKSINHASMMAMQEWEHTYPHDTLIREHCRKPAVAFVETAIMLLADCMWDLETGSWADHGLKELFKVQATLRFWVHQTGDWIAFDNAGLRINHADMTLKNMNAAYPVNGTYDAVDIFVADMREYYEKLNKSHAVKVSHLPLSMGEDQFTGTVGPKPVAPKKKKK